MAVEEKNRRIIAAVRKCAPTVLAPLWAAPFVHHGSTKRTVPPAPAANAVLSAVSDGAASVPRARDAAAVSAPGIVASSDVAESAAASDVEVVGEFIENETGRTFTSRAALTVTKILLYPKVTIGDRPYRHQWGVGEEVCCEWHPVSASLRVALSDGCSEDESHVNRKDFTCPLKSDSCVLRISDGAVEYVPSTQVLEPVGIRACCAEELDFAVPPGIPGGVGFCMDLHVMPDTVSFQGLELMEKPSESGVVEGYFANPFFSAVWHHAEERGAGVWHRIQGDNFWFRDEASMGDELPLPCTAGRIVWEIPIVWKGYGVAKDILTQMVIVPQSFSISSTGTLRVSKYQYWAERALNGQRGCSEEMR